jgi:hypothetical protein
VVSGVEGPPGLVVLRDGQKLARAEWGVGVPVDEGEHEVAGEAPGYRPWRTRVRVTTAQTIEVPRLEPAPTRAESRRSEASPTYWTTLRIVGAAAASAGLLTLASGVVVSLVAKASYDDARGTCKNGDPTNCPIAAVSDGSSARSLATVATVLVASGAVVAGAGGVLFFLAPKGRAGRDVSARLGVGSVEVVGRW